VYYKIKALHSIGVKIILHCYHYGRNPSNKLNYFCDRVYYYARSTGISGFSWSLPYIISSRCSKELLLNLQKDDYPILFEGIHTTFFIRHTELLGRLRMIRTHNIEHEYYHGLMQGERNIFKKLYFLSEFKKLRKYETTLPGDVMIGAISVADMNYFSNRCDSVSHIPAFHPYKEIEIKQGLGDYILFHGNLSVPENIRSLRFLINHVFSKIKQRVIISGKDPSKDIVRKIKHFKNLKLIPNPTDLKMQELIRNAQINILHSFQTTGIKLKLISSLFLGRHCLVNHPVVENTGLDELCIIADDQAQMIRLIEEYSSIPFYADQIEKRNNVLSKHYSNSDNAKKIVEFMRRLDK